MYRTAEWVSPMHPDKMCDRISDAILDVCLQSDPTARVAVEAMGGHGIVHVTGEMTTTAFVDVPEIVHRIVGKPIGVDVNIVQQSPEIAKGVDAGGAGDQGIMIGYACSENDELVPQELFLARSLGRALYEQNPVDGKTQVTTQDKRVHSIVASWQGVSGNELREMVEKWMDGVGIQGATLYCNPAGDWDNGGFDADTGLTGRKLMVDNYGPSVPIGGGCFSGKDSTKVDRSAAYKARQLAVRLLKEKNSTEVQVSLAYAIGKAEPLQVQAVVDGVPQDLTQALDECTPKNIREKLALDEPQYEQLATWGHFGTGNIWDR